MLKVSINGQESVQAEHVVIYDDDAPLAVATQHGNVVFYCDAVRDASDFARVMRDLGIPNTLKVSDVSITGKVQ